MRARPFSVVVALDDSREAREAVVATLALPWPVITRVTGLVALRPFRTLGRPVYVLEAFERAFRRAAASAQQALRRRWAEATVMVVDQAPTDAILAHARRTRPDVIVLGSRGRGWTVRMLLGGVSRVVVHRAPCSVLVVRGRPHRFRKLVIGVDGSAASRQAVDLVARLSPPARGEVTLVAVVEPVPVPPMPAVLRSVREDVAAALARDNEEALAQRLADLRPLERSVRAAGWRARSQAVLGRPLRALLDAVETTGADALVIGARSTSGGDRLLVGSVAEGALDRSPVSVLVAR